MIFDILTLFPGIFASPFSESIVGKARERGFIQIRTHNIRDFAHDKHQMTDDRPFGGGEGMVMKPEPIAKALDTIRSEGPPPKVVLFTPQGRLFHQGLALELSLLPRLILICGRYEGVDERIASHFVDEQISIGDYVLTGGEFAAMIVVDAVTRLIPGVLGNEASAAAESFSQPLLEYPQYTRPQDFRGHIVPQVLLSGNHELIRKWRMGQALLRTKLRRPDIFCRLDLSGEQLKLLEEAEEEMDPEIRDISGKDCRNAVDFFLPCACAPSSAESQG